MSLKSLKQALGAAFLLVSSPLVSAETFHAIIIGETSDPKIAPSVSADIELAQGFAAEVGRHFDSTSITLLEGGSASRREVERAFQELDLDSDDFVFVFFSGHGDQSAAGAPWPRIGLVDNGSVEGMDVLLWLAQQSSLRHLVAFDACNGTAELPPARQPASAAFRAEHVERLFKDMDGSIVITSSEPGHVSYKGRAIPAFTH